MATGIEIRKQRDGSRTYRASVWSATENKRIRRSFPTMVAAKHWRSEAETAVRQGKMRAPSQTTVREAADDLIAGMRSGLIRNKSGDVYKPSVIRSYDEAFRLRLLPALGAKRVSDVQLRDVQAIADKMLAAGSSPSTIRNATMPLRVLYRRAVNRGQATVNPTAGLELPAVRGQRDRIAAPEEAAKLLAKLDDDDRLIYATAMYAGLRRGELMALRWEDVDLQANLIHVRRSWDLQEGEIKPKSKAGERKVPIATVLRETLVAGRLRRGGRGLAFGRSEVSPFEATGLYSRAAKRWEAAELQPIGLHECRHTFASLMIAAGVNAKALSTYMGHGSISITLDRYGHLMPGNEDEAAGLLDAYLLSRGTGHGTVRSTGLVVLLLAVGGVAQAQEPFLPGQVRSQALAEWVWHPACAHVGVGPILGLVTDPAGGDVLGIAWPGECRIQLAPEPIARDSAKWQRGNVGLTKAERRSNRREAEILACTVIVHEYGHLAGQGHSPDPHSVMHEPIEFSYPPCRSLFRPAASRASRGGPQAN